MRLIEIDINNIMKIYYEICVLNTIVLPRLLIFQDELFYNLVF